MTWLTHLRTIVIAFSAFTFCCGLVTQMLARALAFAPELGPPLLDLGGLGLYAPFSFLTWSFTWTTAAPSLLVLSLSLTLVCLLAAYAVAIVCATLQPIALAEPSPWRDLASWRELSHCGLLRDTGLALGAVRRHSLARPSIIRSNSKHVVFLGDPRCTDEAVLAALGSWPGHLLLVSATCSLTERLGRSDVLRFAPGLPDTLSINPLLMLRGGPHAWGDARRLAAALLAGDRPPQAGAVDVFALLMLDQLLCAPVEARTLAVIRHRLLSPTALLSELGGRWASQPLDDATTAVWEMVRVARALRTEPDAALGHLTKVEHALEIFADAGIVQATSAHHLNLTHFVSQPSPQTLVVAMDAIPQESAPLVYAILAQLAALHPDSDAGEVLIAVEANAACVLAARPNAPLPASSASRMLFQSPDVAEAERLLSPDGDAALIAIGPQYEASAKVLSKRAGTCKVFAAAPLAIPRWRRLLFPNWVEKERPRLPAAGLWTASPAEAFLVAPDQKPAHMRVLIGGNATHYASTPQPASHDWEAPPLASTPTSTAPSAVAEKSLTTSPVASAARLRRVLARTGGKPHQKGARTK